MHSLNGLLKKYFKESGIENGLLVNKLQKHWPKLVGKTIAAHTSPEAIKDKQLTITVDTPQWMHHLGFFKEEISEKLKQYDMTEIRFKLGRLSKAEASIPSPNKLELSNDDFAYIEDTLKDINDPELKEKLTKLIAHGLTENRRKT
ncbi:MAG: DUF721 domain-containing protein [Thermodesulfovibrionia bacterium]|nr:DUF721 domain-containing protein [Thermodesulfovibrionia bacterium]